MALFGKRKQEEEAQRRERDAIRAANQVADDRNSAWGDEFDSWVHRVRSAHAARGGAALTDDILAHAGPIPVPNSSGYTHAQLTMLGGYARAAIKGSLQNGRTLELVAPAGPGQAEQEVDVRNRESIEFWESVESYAFQTLG